MDNKTKKQEDKKFSFNIIDIFILLFVLACFVGVALKMGDFGVFDKTDDLEDYRIYFSVSEISHTSSEYFKAGDSVTIADKNIILGKLELINSIEPTKAYVKSSDGDIILVPYPNDTRVDVAGSIISKGVATSKGYMLGGTVHVASGESYLVRTEHMNFVLTVTDIVKK